MNYIVVKLITAEEVIGKIDTDFIDYEEEFFTLKDAMSIFYISDGYGNMAMKMRKYMMCAETNDVEFRTDDVITHSVPRKAITDYYDESVEYTNSLVESIDSVIAKSKDSLVDDRENADEYLEALYDLVKNPTIN